MDSKLRCVFVEGEARDNAQEEQSPSEATESQVRVTLIIISIPYGDNCLRFELKPHFVCTKFVVALCVV